jgi:hypothetical protein
MDNSNDPYVDSTLLDAFPLVVVDTGPFADANLLVVFDE